MPGSEPPRFFLDRSLNGKSIAAALRDGGFDAVTMADMYGEQAGQLIRDEQWISEATAAGLVLLHKDKQVRYRFVEKQAMLDSGARSFALANGNLTSGVMVAWYVNNLPAILAAIARRGNVPFFYNVYADEIKPKRLEP